MSKETMKITVFDDFATVESSDGSSRMFIWSFADVTVEVVSDGTVPNKVIVHPYVIVNALRALVEEPDEA